MALFLGWPFVAAGDGLDRFLGWSGQEEPSSVGPTAVATLEPDPSFEPLGLAGRGALGGGGPFAITGGWVVVPRRGGEGIRLAAVALDGDGEERALPTWAPLVSSLTPTADGIGFWDLERRAIVLLESNLRSEVRIPTGFSVVDSFGVFAGGRILASSLNMQPTPAEDLRALQEREGLSDDDLVARAQCCRDGAVFLLDDRFELLRTLVRRVGRADPRDQAASARNRYRVRMAPDRRMAAVFSRHLPGIALFDESGDLLEVVVHPGEGRTIAEGEPYSAILPAGGRGFYQTDVALTPEHIFVADPASDRVWRRVLSGGAWSAVEVPLVRLQVRGAGLYGIDEEGVLTRYLLPD